MYRTIEDNLAKRIKHTAMKTYDVHFNDEQDSNNKGFEMTKQEAINYIKAFNGTNNSYFADYKGGIVSVVCNETGVTVYDEEIR